MNNQNRRISLVVPQPTGGQQNVQNNSSQQNIHHFQQVGVLPQHAQNTSSSVDGRKKNVTDKKKKSQGKIVQEISSSMERLAHHKFSASGYVSAQAFNLNHGSNQASNSDGNQFSGKKKISVSRVSNHHCGSNDGNHGVSIVNQKVTQKTLNSVYTQDQLKQMRTQTLSPPPNNKQKQVSTHQNIALSKSGQKNTNSSLQRSQKKISQLKSLVKKQQQQKSLSRDFTNALMNTNNINKQSQGQFQLFKSHNQAQLNSSSNNNTILNGTLNCSQGLYHQIQTMPNTSLSPNSRLTGLNSSQKKKKKQIIRKKKDDNSLTQSVQIFKPPINKSIQNVLMQTSLNLKSGFNSILNDSKEGSLTRVSLSQYPNMSLSMNQSALQNLTQNQSQVLNQNASQNFNVKQSNTQKSQIRKQQRSNTQERVLKLAEAQISQIEQELHFTNKKTGSIANTNHQSISSSQTSLQPEQQKLRQLVQNTLQNQCEYLNKENTNKQVNLGANQKKIQQNQSQYNSAYIKTDDLFHLDKTFSDIIETIQNQAAPSDNQIQQMKQQANLTLIKSQLEKIKNSYEQIIKRLSDSQNTQSLSARLKQQRLLSDRQNEDDNTTHASNSNNDCFSVSSSFRTQQNLVNQTQMQQKIMELEQKNLILSSQMKAKDETISHQEQIIQLLKQETKKENVGVQTSTESACQTPVITERKADLIVENEQLKRQQKRLQKKIDYHKNKENKFLFFLFSLQNQGIPVNEIYEKEGIKDIPTSRFAEIMAEDQAQNQNQSSILFSFYSDDSYELIDDGPDPAKIRTRPNFIPSLNLNNLPEYESSSDEEGDQDPNKPTEGQEQNGVAHRNMTSQDYEQSMKYIENFYNKVGPQNTLGSEDGELEEQEDFENLERDNFDHDMIHQHSTSSHDFSQQQHYSHKANHRGRNHQSQLQSQINDQDYIMCQINQGSSILLFDKEDNASHSNIQPAASISHMNPSSMMMDDGDFCYSIDKQSKRRSSKDMISI